MATDHLGNKFKTTREMYLHYGLNESLYYRRKSMGFSLKKILSTPRRIYKNSCLDDTLTYKRHQVQKRAYKTPLREQEEVKFKLPHGTVTVTEYWRGKK